MIRQFSAIWATKPDPFGVSLIHVISHILHFNITFSHGAPNHKYTLVTFKLKLSTMGVHVCVAMVDSVVAMASGLRINQKQRELVIFLICVIPRCNLPQIKLILKCRCHTNH